MKKTSKLAEGAQDWLYSRKPKTDESSSSNQLDKQLNDQALSNGSVAVLPSFAPVVKISFQTDFHGFVQLGLIDVPWLPSLIRSYLIERLQDSGTSVEDQPGFSHSLEPEALALSNTASRLRSLAATSSPMVQDTRTYEIIHWSLSPECRWLIAKHICVPAFDKLLESIGFRKARVTIPKWLQRGVMDHLDQVTSLLLGASMQLIGKASDDDNKVYGEGSEQRASPSASVLPLKSIPSESEYTACQSAESFSLDSPSHAKLKSPTFALAFDSDDFHPQCL